MNNIINDTVITSVSYTPMQIILILSVALIGGLFIYLIYRLTTDETMYNRNFNIGNVALCLITAVIMMMLASNVIVSLGMVGALSIVRFRTAVKEPRDTVFIFWAITYGLCAGSQNFMLAVLTVIFIGVVLLAFSYTGKISSGIYTLVVRTENADKEKIEKIISENSKKYTFKALNKYGSGEELVYRISLSADKRISFVDKLGAEQGVLQVNISETETLF